MNGGLSGWLSEQMSERGQNAGMTVVGWAGRRSPFSCCGVLSIGFSELYGSHWLGKRDLGAWSKFNRNFKERR